MTATNCKKMNGWPNCKVYFEVTNSQIEIPCRNSVFLKKCLYLCTYFEKQTQREESTDRVSKWLRLMQVEAGSWEPNAVISYAWKECNYLSHRWFLGCSLVGSQKWEQSQDLYPGILSSDVAIQSFILASRPKACPKLVFNIMPS